MAKDNRKLTRAARARAAQTGETYHQARRTIVHALAEPAEPDMAELVRRLQADQAIAGITLTDERAREMVQITVGVFRRYMTSAPWTAPAFAGGLIGPHCDHHDDCAMHLCQDGYAWRPCRTAGCPICGGPPVETPEHWAGSVVALALMTDTDRGRALAHQQTFPLLRRPGDPPVIPDERQHADEEPDRECCECGAWVQAGYSCDCHNRDLYLEEEYG